MTQSYHKPTIIATLLSAMLAVTSSCGDEPAAGGNDAEANISFGRPTIGVATASRSTMVSDLLPSGSAFDVYGYCVPYTVGTTSVTTDPDYAGASSGWPTKSEFVHPDVFSATKVTVRDNGCSYTDHNGKRPWYTAGSAGVPQTSPTDRYLYSFFGLYPSGSFTNLKTGTAPADRGYPRFSFDMPFNGGTATTARDHNAIHDAMYASRIDLRRSDGLVNLNFEHLLSAFSFRFNNYNTSDLTVTALTLSGQFFRTVSLTFETATPVLSTTPLTSSSYSGSFSFLDSPLTVVNGSGAEVKTPSPLFLLPDYSATIDGIANSLGSGLKLSVTYSFAGGSSKTSETEFKPASLPEGGNHYVANLNFVGDRFVLIFQDATDRWENGSDNDIIIH